MRALLLAIIIFALLVVIRLCWEQSKTTTMKVIATVAGIGALAYTLALVAYHTTQGSIL